MCYREFCINRCKASSKYGVLPLPDGAHMVRPFSRPVLVVIGELYPPELTVETYKLQDSFLSSRTGPLEPLLLQVMPNVVLI